MGWTLSHINRKAAKCGFPKFCFVWEDMKNNRRLEESGAKGDCNSAKLKEKNYQFEFRREYGQLYHTIVKKITISWLIYQEFLFIVNTIYSLSILVLSLFHDAKSVSNDNYSLLAKISATQALLKWSRWKC